jgi:hypothetical protein
MSANGARASRVAPVCFAPAQRAGVPAAQYWVGRQLRATAPCHPHADGSDAYYVRTQLAALLATSPIERAMSERLAAYRGGRTWTEDLLALPAAGAP